MDSLYVTFIPLLSVNPALGSHFFVLITLKKKETASKRSKFRFQSLETLCKAGSILK